MRSKSSEQRKNRVWIKVLRTVIILAAAFVVVVLGSEFDFGKLQVSFYQVQNDEVFQPVRVVLLTDLHLREFGKGNSELLDRVESLEPDIIAVAGDLTIYGNYEHGPAIYLLNALSEIAPVYYSYGNHEYQEILFTKGSTLRKELDETKATVVNKTCEKINIKGTDFVIGGLCVGEKNFDKKFDDYMTEFCQQEGFKILLCHHVELFEGSLAKYPVDLGLAGHAHGGQIIVPMVGPLYSPDQGWFPKLTSGKKVLGESTVVISRGLGNSTKIPRYNNNPEIVVIDINNF